MRRRSFLKKAGLGTLAGTATLAAPSIAQEFPKISWTMTSLHGPSRPPLYSVAQLFCKMVEEASGGNFSIQLRAADDIVPASDILDAVGNRVVDCAQTASSYYYDKDPSFCFDTGVPFGLNSRQMFSWMYEGDGMTLMRELFAPHHIINFPFGNTGTQMGGWYRNEIKSVDDLKGLKMRTAAFAGQVLARLGVEPHQVAHDDIYSSLESGALDAVEFVGPVDDEAFGFQKIVKYYYYPGWWEGSAQVSLYVHDGAYNELPLQYQSLIATSSRAAGAQLQGHYDAHNSGALRRMIADGAVLKAFPRDVMDAAFEVSGQLFDELCEQNETFRKIHDNYMGFRGKIVPWFRVAEGTYDNYLGIALANPRK